MNNVQLELEKIIEYFDEKIETQTGSYGMVAKQAYINAKKKCEELMEVIVGVYSEQENNDSVPLGEVTFVPPEFRSEDIQE